MSHPLKIAIIPYDIAWGDKDENLLSIGEKLRRVESDTDIVVFNKPAGVIEAYSPPETTSQLKSAFVAFNGNTVALNCSDFEPFTDVAFSVVVIAISETGVYLIAASSITAMFVKYVFPVAVITTLFAPSV